MIKKEIIKSNPRDEHIPYIYLAKNEKFKDEVLTLIEGMKEIIKKTKNSQIRRIYNILRDTNSQDEVIKFVEKQREKLENDDLYNRLDEMFPKYKKKYGDKFIEFLQIFVFEMLIYKKVVEDK